MWSRLTNAGFAAVLALGVSAFTEPPRERILVVSGASSFDYARAIVHAFGRVPARLQPNLEADANADTLAGFCSGVGLGFADAAISVERLGGPSQRACRASGVTPIELKLGLQGIAVVETASAAPMVLTRRALFLAAARDVPMGPNGALIPNPFLTWHDIDAKLPARPIRLFVPPRDTSQRDGWTNLVMLAGARQFPALAELAARDPATFTAFATTLRDSGEVTEQDAAGLKAALETAPDALAVVDLGAAGAFRSVAVDGATPDKAKLGAPYVLARPIYLYVKREHLGIVRSLSDLLTEAAGENALGDGGYLAGLGLVPLTTRERTAERDHVAAVQTKALMLARSR